MHYNHLPPPPHQKKNKRNINKNYVEMTLKSSYQSLKNIPNSQTITPLIAVLTFQEVEKNAQN